MTEAELVAGFEALMNLGLFFGIAFCVLIAIGLLLTKSFKLLFIETPFGYIAIGIGLLLKAVLTLLSNLGKA